MKKFTKNFKLVLMSNAISNFGGQILRFALILFMVDLAGSASTLGIATAITQIPVFLLSPVGGSMADRMSKKHLILVLDFVSVLLCLILMFIFLTQSYSVINLTLILTAFMSIVTIISPAFFAAMPSIVEKDDLVEANGAFSALRSIANLAGPILGGISIATIGAFNTIIFIGACFLISTLLDLFIKIPFHKQEQKSAIFKSLPSDIRVSLNYMIKDNPRLLKVVLTFTIINLFMMPIFAITVPYIVRITFDSSDGIFGISKGFIGAGAILAGMLAGKLKNWLEIHHLFKWVLALGLVVIVVSISVYPPFLSGGITAFWLFNSSFLIIMGIGTLIMIMSNVIMQQTTPEHLLGRVDAVIMTIVNFLVPISQLLIGVIMDLLGHQLFLLFLGVAVLIVILSIFVKMSISTHTT